MHLIAITSRAQRGLEENLVVLVSESVEINGSQTNSSAKRNSYQLIHLNMFNSVLAWDHRLLKLCSNEIKSHIVSDSGCYYSYANLVKPRILSKLLTKANPHIEVLFDQQ